MLRILAWFLGLFVLTAPTAPPNDLDPTFGVNGIVVSDVGPLTEEINDLKIQPDGKIVVAAWYENGTNRVCAIFRYTVSGDLDPSFGVGGKVIADVGGTSQTYESLVIQPDGKIVVVGSTFTMPVTQYVLGRYNADGSPDGSFGTNGIVKSSFGTSTQDLLLAVTLQSDGKIVAVGSSRPPTLQQFVVARFLANGMPDPSFGNAGTSVFGFTNQSSQAQAVLIRSNGKIVVGGGTTATGGSDIAIATLNSDGMLDESFGTSGKVVTANPGSDNPVDMVLQTDGKIVMGGSNAGSYLLARYTSIGTLDSSFGNNGIAVINAGGGVAEIAVQTNGKIVAVGTVSQNLGIVRFDASGSADTSFGTNGIVSFPVTTGSSNGVDAVALQSDGKIVIGCGTLPMGASQWMFALARFLGDPVLSVARSPIDFDGDGKTDIGIFRPAVGEWWVNRSSDATTVALQFGASTDKITPGDFTGDGKADIAFFRPSTGSWFVLRSEDFSFFAFPFGANGDTPVVGDFDADSKTDAAVFRPSTQNWFILRSTGGTDVYSFGAADDKPVVADYGGDSKADIAIFRPGPGEWWVRRSSNQTVFALQFGSSTDRVVQGDYTGDGKVDIAFWRPSTGYWNILRSEDFSYFAFPFGIGNDIPVPGDYDGDGRFDAGVFRPSETNWYIQRTTNGTLIQQFGASGDVPLPNAFAP